MLNAEAAESNSSLRSQKTVRGFPELRDDRWSGASLRASLGEVETEPDIRKDVRDTRRSQSVDLSVTSGSIVDHTVMINKDRDFSVSVLSDSAKSSRRKSWVSPLRFLEKVRTRKSFGSPGGGNGSPGRKHGVLKE